MTRRREIRGLTEGERAILRPLFGERLDMARMRLRRGAGANVVAWIALRAGFAGIVIGQTVCVRADRYRADFSACLADVRFLAHEATHVWQNQSGGINVFRYLWQSLTLPGRGYTIAHLSPDAEFEALGYEQQAEVMAGRAHHHWNSKVMLDPLA